MTIHLKTGVEATPETSSISSMSQTMDNVLVMNQPLSQTSVFTESHEYAFLL
jgi:hypothetical protein